jgi:hypothetical protein
MHSILPDQFIRPRQLLRDTSNHKTHQAIQPDRKRRRRRKRRREKRKRKRMATTKALLRNN